MNRLENILKAISLKYIYMYILHISSFFPTEKNYTLHSTVQPADAAHLLALKVAYIKNRAKHINSMCWQTVETLVSRTGCTGCV